MARKKEFNREEAVHKAMAVFWEKGYEGTSTDDLLAGMGIGRQSMYDTFGDKHQLYLEALQRYVSDSVGNLLLCLRGESSSILAIRKVLLEIASGTAEHQAMGCMGVNAVSEFGQTDKDVNDILQSGGTLLESTLERVVSDGQKKGEIRASLQPRIAASFLSSTLLGLKVSAKGGASQEALHAIVDFALEGLKAPA
ncbi:TetR/AcrR family transcriptional regulator [Undibacterium terreum]|uniref:TetR family transcriptional regulator n=1 Tax=Undibacterium terreum TaxID=1224302 RepID=A0A916U4U9_9BURK|nr:TetR/AcrR family transcriptional regulator [Undibacterium terreum]GGC60750.1 TetR family transcriptional regulator [Undibacterium terreum]